MAKKSRSRQFKHSSPVIDIEEARAKRRQRLEFQREDLDAGRTTVGKDAIRKRAQQSRRKRTLICLVVIVVLVVLVTTSIVNIVSLRQERGVLDQEKLELLSRQEDLVEELKHLNDPAYIEEKARTQLRLIRPGDKLYLFPQWEPDKPTMPSEKTNNGN